VFWDSSLSAKLIDSSLQLLLYLLQVVHPLLTWACCCLVCAEDMQDAAVEFVASRIHQLLQEDDAAAAAAVQPVDYVAAAPGLVGLGADMTPAGDSEPPLHKALIVPSGSSGPLSPTVEASVVGQQQQQEDELAAVEDDKQQQEEAADAVSGLGSCCVTAAYDAEAGGEDEAAAAAAAGARPGNSGVTWQRIYLISTYVVGKERLLLATAQRTGRGCW